MEGLSLFGPIVLLLIAALLMAWVVWRPPARFVATQLNYYGTPIIVIEDRLRDEFLGHEGGGMMEFTTIEAAREHAARLNAGRTGVEV